MPSVLAVSAASSHCSGVFAIATIVDDNAAFVDLDL
jgi:hypothetical protein